MIRRRLLVVLPVLALGAGVALTAATGSANAAPAGTDGKTYVAMGDSYAAGYGLPPSEGTLTGQPVPGCAQTTGDYPHLLAGTLGLDLTDVTCSGATTSDFANPQTAAGAAPQLDVFTTVQPDLVTVTIGGNDLGFSTISLNCLAGGANGPVLAHPTFNSCKAFFESLPADSQLNPYNRIASTLTAVDGAIKAVKTAAPNAKIAVIAYPAIAPDAANTPAGGCYAANATPAPVTVPIPGGGHITLNSVFPFTDTDVPFLQVLQQRLDDGIGGVAAANGAEYADIYPDSLAHSACQPEDTRWVEPIIPAAAAQGATNTLHPNLAGTTAMANALDPVVQALFPTAPTSTPPSSGSPTPSTGTSTGASTVAAGGEPLANTGTKIPVTWLLVLAAVAVTVGGVSLGLGRPRRARH